MRNTSHNKNSFIRILVALSTSTGIQIAIQIVSIPIFLNYLTLKEYSVWIVATNLAQVSALLDLGTLSSIQNKFTYLGKLGDDTKIRKIIEQFSNIIAVTHLLAILTGIVLILKTDLPITLALIFLSSSLLQAVFGLYEALTRMRGNIPKGLAVSNILRISEFLGYLFALLLLPVSINYVALSGFIFKFLTFFSLYFTFERKNRFILLNTPDIKLMINCVREGFPFLITRISDFVILSGVLIVLQGQLSPLEIVAFSAGRTFFRLGLQITNLFNHAYGYQMSESWAEGNWTKMNRIVQKSFRVTLFLSILGAIIYYSLGNFLFQFWTHNSVFVTQNFFLVGAIYSLVVSINQGQKVKFNATNANLRVAYILLAMSTLQIVFTMTLGKSLNLEMYFCSLVINEVVCFIAVSIFNRNIIMERFRYSLD